MVDTWICSTNHTLRLNVYCKFTGCHEYARILSQKPSKVAWICRYSLRRASKVQWICRYPLQAALKVPWICKGFFPKSFEKCHEYADILFKQTLNSAMNMQVFSSNEPWKAPWICRYSLQAALKVPWICRDSLPKALENAMHIQVSSSKSLYKCHEYAGILFKQP